MPDESTHVKPPTERQLQVLDEIDRAIRVYALDLQPVTFRRLMPFIKVKSTNSVARFIQLLVAAGLLFRLDTPQAFAITDVGRAMLEAWRDRDPA